MYWLFSYSSNFEKILNGDKSYKKPFIPLNLNPNFFIYKMYFSHTPFIKKKKKNFISLPKFKNNSESVCNRSIYPKGNRWASERRVLIHASSHPIVKG